MPVCDKCEARIPEGANFCPKCADPVTEADYEAEPSSRDGVSEISIEFGHSTSSRYEDAVELASRVPSYERSGEGTDVSHRVTLETSDVALATSLWDLVSNWTSSRMEIDGEGASKRDLTYGALGCYQSRQDAYSPTEYCYGEGEYNQNIWGCHKLGLPLAGWRDSWFTWGGFDDEGRWHWDRERISHELEKGLHEYRHCPVLNRDAVLAVLESLPDGIDPTTNPRWNYVTDWDGNREVPIGVCSTLAEAKRLSVGDHTPAWDANQSLDRASSKLESFKDRTLKVRPSTSPSKSGSGCLVLIGLLTAAAAVALF